MPSAALVNDMKIAVLVFVALLLVAIQFPVPSFARDKSYITVGEHERIQPVGGFIGFVLPRRNGRKEKQQKRRRL